MKNPNTPSAKSLQPSFRKKALAILSLAGSLMACDSKTDEAVTPKSSVSASASAAPQPTAFLNPIAPKVERQKVKKPERPKRKLINPTDDPTEIGPTVFFGDSLTYKLGELGGKLDIEDYRVIAKGNMKSSWVLEQAQALGRSGGLSHFENAVVLVGTNDLGKYTVKNSIDNIENTYRVLSGDLDHDGNKDVEGIDHIYGVTIPPFEGENTYSSEKNFEPFNSKRKEINRLIKNSRLLYQVIDLAAKRENGGFADNENLNKLTSIGPNNWEYDVTEGIHFPKSWLRMVYERELKKGTRRANGQ